MSLLARIGSRLRRELSAHWPWCNPGLPAAFGDVLRAMGIGPGSRVLLALDQRALLEALPVPAVGGMSVRRAQHEMVETTLTLVGGNGLLAIPYHPVADPKKLSHERTVFSHETARPRGLAGALLARSGSACSTAPVLAVAAAGAGADALVEGQIQAAPFPMGPGSPWEKMLNYPTRLVMTRTSATVNFGLLLAAHLHAATYMRPAFFHRPFPFVVRDGDSVVETAFHLHACPFQPQYDLSGYADFNRYMDYLDDKYRLLMAVRLGSQVLVTCDYKALYQACVGEMAGDTYLEDARFW